MIDLTAVLVTFFAVAGVAIVLAVATLTRVVLGSTNSRQARVVPIGAGHPAAAGHAA